MATYKVIQDVEAEDKFVGPLTLKQFILAGVTFVSGYLSFVFLTKHLWILALPLLPVILLSGFLAWPWGRDQPTEVWLLAKIRFMLKPRRRIWDQTGMQELVTITAPRHEERYTADDLSPTEVKSRLRALADTIDSRGWAVKNASVNLYTQPTYAATHQPTDRLLDLDDFAHEVPNVDVQAADDIMDEHNNPTAQHLDQMIAESTTAHRQQTIQNFKHTIEHEQPQAHKADNPTPAQPEHWFMKTDAPTHTPVVSKHKTHQLSQKPSSHNQTSQTAKHRTRHTTHHNNRDVNTSPIGRNPAILGLAGNDDLTVATIAHEANKKRPPSDDEVVVKLR